MTRLLRVARREYLERVRSKAFIVGTLIGPVVLFGVMLGPSLLLSKQRGKALRIAVLDQTGVLREPVVKSLATREAAGQRRFEIEPPEGQAGPGVSDALRERVRRGALDGFVEVKGDGAEASAEYYGRNVSNLMDIQLIEHAVEEAVVDQRLTAAGLASDRVRALTRPPSFKTIQVTAQGAREDRREAFVVSGLLLTLLYTSLAMWGSAIMNGVLEEKTNRVVEVVVSSIPPVYLFGGKLLGVGAAGLTQFTIWGGTLVVIASYGAALGGGAPLPGIDVGTFGAFVLFFLLGYFFYGALFAGLGATVNTQQEAQSLAFIVMMPLIGGLALFPVVLNSPDGPLAVALSLVPFFSPMLMFLRISTVTPPAWQIALSIGLLLLGIAGAVAAASRVYRTGILMYGKRATFREIARWIRES